jgi:NADPH:quinone reductase-like Zn-dependent oxidoreductase
VEGVPGPAWNSTSGRREPKPPVFARIEDDESVFAAMRAGARGYVLKGAEQEEIVGAIQAVSRGEAIFGPEAGGSVGPFAVQIAKCFGADVTAVDSTSKLEMLHSIGADHVIDYTREDFTRNGLRYDRILDLVARRSIFDCRRALNPGESTCWREARQVHCSKLRSWDR